MFKGTTRAVFIDKREYSGPLWKQIDDAFQFVLRNIHLGARLEGIYRKNGHIVYLKHPAVWYTAEGGITALDLMLQDLETALLQN